MKYFSGIGQALKSLISGKDLSGLNQGQLDLYQELSQKLNSMSNLERTQKARMLDSLPELIKSRDSKDLSDQVAAMKDLSDQVAAMKDLDSEISGRNDLGYGPSGLLKDLNNLGADFLDFAAKQQQIDSTAIAAAPAVIMDSDPLQTQAPQELTTPVVEASALSSVSATDNPGTPYASSPPVMIESVAQPPMGELLAPLTQVAPQRVTLPSMSPKEEEVDANALMQESLKIKLEIRRLKTDLTDVSGEELESKKAEIAALEAQLAEKEAANIGKVRQAAERESRDTGDSAARALARSRQAKERAHDPEEAIQKFASQPYFMQFQEIISSPAMAANSQQLPVLMQVLVSQDEVQRAKTLTDLKRVEKNSLGFFNKIGDYEREMKSKGTAQSAFTPAAQARPNMSAMLFGGTKARRSVIPESVAGEARAAGAGIAAKSESGSTVATPSSTAISIKGDSSPSLG